MKRMVNRRKFLAGGAGLAAGTAIIGSQPALAQSTPAPGELVPPTTDTAVSGRIRYQIVPSGPNDVNVLQEFFNTTFRETYADL